MTNNSDSEVAYRLRELSTDPEYTESRIQDAIDVAEAMDQNGLRNIEVYAGDRGVIALVSWRGDNAYEFRYEPNGTWSFLHEIDDKEEMKQNGLTFEDLVVTLMIIP